MVTWNAEKDQIILKGIFAYHHIKNSKPFLAYLAENIGEGCTVKAVSHRLTNLRNSGKMVSSPGSVKATPKRASVVKVPHTPKTPASGSTNSKLSKKISDDETSENDDCDDDEQVISPSVGRKRRVSKVPASYAESDATAGDDSEGEFAPVSKRVKVEPNEDKDAGVDAGDDIAEEQDDEGIAFI